MEPVKSAKDLSRLLISIIKRYYTYSSPQTSARKKENYARVLRRLQVLVRVRTSASVGCKSLCFTHGSPSTLPAAAKFNHVQRQARLSIRRRRQITFDYSLQPQGILGRRDTVLLPRENGLALSSGTLWPQRFFSRITAPPAILLIYISSALRDLLRSTLTSAKNTRRSIRRQ
jgi:hypothetical protein